MIIDLSSKVVVITGSSRGIGRELAKAFAKENASVVMNYCNSSAEAKKLLDEITSGNRNCIKVKADITCPHDVTKLYEATMQTFGKVDILINNAGICNDNIINNMDLKQWQRVIDVNLTGTFLCSKVFSNEMMRQSNGKIINIASFIGEAGSAGQVNYSASKAGVIGLTKSLAKELGQYNVAVNAVCPGFILTDLNRHCYRKEQIAKAKSVLSINSLMQDLIDFMLFASSDHFSGISGQVFHLDSRIM